MEASHGKSKHTHIPREVFNQAVCKRVRDALVSEEDLSNQVRQAFNDSAVAAVVGEGEDGLDKAGSWAVQEIREGDCGGAGEEVGVAKRTGPGDADAQLLRELRREES